MTVCCLQNLGLDTLDVVNPRGEGVMTPTPGSVEEPLTIQAELKRHGPIRRPGLSNITPEQLAEGQKITEIVCVHVAQRNEDGFIDDLATRGIAYVPFFPLGALTPLQSSALDGADARQQMPFANVVPEKARHRTLGARKPCFPKTGRWYTVYPVEDLAVYTLLNYGHKKEGDN